MPFEWRIAPEDPDGDQLEVYMNNVGAPLGAVKDALERAFARRDGDLREYSLIPTKEESGEHRFEVRHGNSFLTAVKLFCDTRVAATNVVIENCDPRRGYYGHAWKRMAILVVRGLCAELSSRGHISTADMASLLRDLEPYGRR